MQSTSPNMAIEHNTFHIFYTKITINQSFTAISKLKQVNPLELLKDIIIQGIPTTFIQHTWASIGPIYFGCMVLA